MLTVGELFAGVGGFSQGFDRAGFRTEWQCEIDPDAVSVLERHYPSVTRYRDVREIDPSRLEPVDVVTFGSPCQGFSVAGLGEGLEDERSGLFHEAIRIISGLRPTPSLVVWENVPGAFSASGGRDFGAVLTALAKLGALDISWRVLDAQWFGVPQRRRRIFLVADFGGERAASVLFESESVRGDSAPCGEARQTAARDTEDGAGSRGVAGTLRSHPRPGSNDVGAIAYTLAASARGTGDGHGNAWNSTYVPVSGEAVRDCLTAHGGSHGRIDAESETFVVAVDGQSGSSGPLVGTLCSDQGTAGGFMVAAFDERQITSKANRSTVERGADGPTLNGSAGMSVVAAPLTAGGHPNSNAPGRHREDDENLVAFHLTQDPISSEMVTPGLSIGGRGGQASVGLMQAMSVRRLTPRECERLQGFPDDFTRWRTDGTELSDGARYRCMGNAVAVPVVEWLAHRVRAALEAS